MSQLFEPRIVHSVYYDTPTLDLYSDSEEGVLPRKKIRVRCYNSGSSYYLETKVTGVEGRFKTSRPLVKGRPVPRKIADDLYGLVEPKLSVRYVREYHELRGLRITFDRDIKYRSAKDGLGCVFEDCERVMEIKAVESVSDDFIYSVLPVTPTRFSKYCRGIDCISGPPRGATVAS